MKLKELGKKLTAVFSAAAMLAGSAAASPATVRADSSWTYGDALKLSLYFYDANQCGTEVNGNALTWRSNCHTYDAEASLDSATGLDDSAKAVIRAANGGQNYADVSGGYHDAGDHIKSSMTMGFSAASLAWAMYSYQSVFDKTGSAPHALYILKQMCDYFMKVTYLDDSGSVAAACYLVSNSGDHNDWLPPERQTSARPTYWATASHPQADATGEMAAALASSSVIFQRYGYTEYASRCLKYAEALRDFTKAHVSSSNDGIGDMYSSDSQDDDAAWADLWCHIADGTLSSYSRSYPQDYWIYCWNKVTGGYTALLYETGKDSSGSEVKSNAQNFLGNSAQGSYIICGSDWGSSRYNCAAQMYCLKVAEKTNDSSWAAKAKYQMDYLLGGNSGGTSFLLGYGTSWPKQPHHRGANPNKGNAVYTLYGGLVGGPKDSSGSYDDVWDSYQCTEPALDYEGCFELAIAGLASWYGETSTAQADSAVSSASEINASCSFALNMTGEATPTPTATPEPTATPVPTSTPVPTRGAELYSDIDLDGTPGV